MAEEARIKELKDKMAKERGKLLSILELLSEEEAEKSPQPGEWTVKQQMSHLCEMESAYRAWVEKALAEDGANLDGVQGEPVAIPLERAHLNAVPEHVTEMRASLSPASAWMRARR